MKGSFITGLMIMILLQGTSLAQDRAALEMDKELVEDQIKYTNKLLERVRESRSTSMNELSILDNRIGKREELIATLNSEIFLLELQMDNYQDSIRILSRELEILKEDYARMVFSAYKNSNIYNRIMFIFAAEDFNQAYQRVKYYQYYNSFRKNQAALISRTRTEIADKSLELSQNRDEKNKLLSQVEDERYSMLREKEEKDQAVRKLRDRESELKKTLADKERARQKLQSAIEEIIAEELRKAEELNRAKGTFSLTPEEMLLSDNFASNMGKLPWPLEKGIISETFGEHRHPVLSKVKVKNNGIVILTEEGTEARAVFSGKVTRVLSVPNNNNVVIVRHGEYLTVYSNLDKVYVKQGDVVETKQPIGLVFTNPDESKTELHFQVWKSKTLLNPANWLTKAM
jgi:septal ring factor EnvC (AmiA/AmiB activator)